MAGDLSARIFHPPTADDESKIATALRAGNARIRNSIDLGHGNYFDGFGAAGPGAICWLSLKAVDPSQYPYYGKADLEPAMSLATGACREIRLWLRMSS